MATARGWESSWAGTLPLHLRTWLPLTLLFAFADSDLYLPLTLLFAFTDSDLYLPLTLLFPFADSDLYLFTATSHDYEAGSLVGPACDSLNLGWSWDASRNTGMVRPSLQAVFP